MGTSKNNGTPVWELNLLPEKEEGKHRWVCIPTFAITRSEASILDEGGWMTLARSRCVSMFVGCVDCHAEYPCVEWCELADA